VGPHRSRPISPTPFRVPTPTRSSSRLHPLSFCRAAFPRPRPLSRRGAVSQSFEAVFATPCEWLFPIHAAAISTPATARRSRRLNKLRDWNRQSALLAALPITARPLLLRRRLHHRRHRSSPPRLCILALFARPACPPRSKPLPARGILSSTALRRTDCTPPQTNARFRSASAYGTWPPPCSPFLPCLRRRGPSIPWILRPRLPPPRPSSNSLRQYRLGPRLPHPFTRVSILPPLRPPMTLSQLNPQSPVSPSPRNRQSRLSSIRQIVLKPSVIAKKRQSTQFPPPSWRRPTSRRKDNPCLRHPTYSLGCMV
jgi:hypothetical protein